MTTISRRKLLAAGCGFATMPTLPACSAEGLLTPPQTEGPFYPPTLPLDRDNDLVRVEGRSETAAGTILDLGGRVLDPQGSALSGIRIEIWQCDAFGTYHHPHDRRGPADPNFQGFGYTVADAQGTYRFRTIVPVGYPGRTAHIHFKILGPDFEALTTQMYVAGNPENERDRLYRSLGRASDLMTVALAPGDAGTMHGRFDILMGPDGSADRN